MVYDIIQARALNNGKIFVMKTEFEATFPKVNKDKVRTKLKSIGAKLVRKEFLQKRFAFRLPKGHEIEGGWLRVRDEGDKITMSLKVVNGTSIKDQKEICLQVDSFKEAAMFLQAIGCEKKAYQETKREIWSLGKVEVTIDEWPFLEPFVEIEGTSEKAVVEASKILGFKYEDAIFGAADIQIHRKYGIPLDAINNHTPEIRFSRPNPFINRD